MKLEKAIEGFRLVSLAEGMSPRTMDGYEWALGRLTKFLDNQGTGNPEVEEIQPADMRRFFLYLRTETDLAPASIRSIWRTIRSFYNWASRDLGVDRPDRGIPAPKVGTKAIVPFSEDEVKALLRACEYTSTACTNGRQAFRMRRPHARRDKALVLLLLDTGMRVSECARLLVRDVNLETGAVEVRPFRSGLKSKGRTVFLGKTTRKAVWLYLTDRDDLEPDDSLLITQNGHPMNRSSIAHMLSRLGERAEVDKVHPHRFRHTSAIQYLRNGGDVFTLQRLLGHSSLAMVNRYLAIAEVDLANAHRRASPADNWRL
jgi:integrase/recombinase XerD